MSLEQQKDILDHTFDLLTKFNNGIPPKGSVAPWWETSKEGTGLLLEKGIEYGMLVINCQEVRVIKCVFSNYTIIDHSNMAHEYVNSTVYR